MEARRIGWRRKESRTPKCRSGSTRESAITSHAQVQMARELGMNPIELGKLDNHKQESRKMPLREYIEHLYLKRFGKSSPDNIMSVEERLRLAQQKKETRRASSGSTDSHISRKALANAQLADPKKSSRGEFEEVIMIEVVDRKSAVP